MKNVLFSSQAHKLKSMQAFELSHMLDSKEGKSLQSIQYTGESL